MDHDFLGVVGLVKPVIRPIMDRYCQISLVSERVESRRQQRTSATRSHSDRHEQRAQAQANLFTGILKTEEGKRKKKEEVK